MEEFKRELNLLLAKYPDLPEFTITISPRVKIEFKQPVSVPPLVTPPPLIPAQAQTEGGILEQTTKARLADVIKTVNQSIEIQ